MNESDKAPAWAEDLVRRVEAAAETMADAVGKLECTILEQTASQEQAAEEEIERNRQERGY